MVLSDKERALERHHEERMMKIAEQAKKYEYKEIEKEAIEKYKPKKERKWTASKMILTIALCISVEIIFFTEYAMFKYENFSSLYSLIGIPATVIGMMGMILGYFNKAKAENTEGGVTYEKAMRSYDCGSPVPPETQSDTFNSNAD